jgi:hypothetical protein
MLSWELLNVPRKSTKNLTHIRFAGLDSNRVSPEYQSRANRCNILPGSTVLFDDGSKFVIRWYISVERSIFRYQDSIWNAVSDYGRTVILYINTVWFVLRGRELFKIDIFRKHDLVLMTICFVFINYFQKIVFQQKVTLKSIVQPLPQGAEGIRNMLASLGLRWWQYTS